MVRAPFPILKQAQISRRSNQLSSLQKSVCDFFCLSALPFLPQNEACNCKVLHSHDHNLSDAQCAAASTRILKSQINLWVSLKGAHLTKLSWSGTLTLASCKSWVQACGIVFEGMCSIYWGSYCIWVLRFHPYGHLIKHKNKATVRN